MNSFIVYGLIMGVLGLATLRRPGTAFGGVVCMFAIEEWSQGSNPFFLRYHALTNLLIGVFVLLGLVAQFFRRNLFSGISLKLTLWIILLFAYAFMSVAWSPRPDLSMEVWGAHSAYVLTEIVLAPLLLCRQADFRDAMGTIAILGSVLTLLLLYTVKWEYRYIVFAYQGDNVIHGNPLVPAQVAGCALFAVLFAKPRRLRLIWPLVKWSIIGFCLLLMVRTGSRGQVLGAVIAMMAAWPVAVRMKNAGSYLSIVLGVAVVLGICYEAYESYWMTRENRGLADRWGGEGMGKDISGRLDSAFILLGHWADNPLAVFLGLGNSASYDPKILGIYPHFVPLEILGEEGLIGFGLFLWIMYLSLRNIRAGFKEISTDESLRRTFGTYFAIFVYLFILSLKQGNMLGNVLMFTFLIVMDRFKGATVIEKARPAVSSRKRHSHERTLPLVPSSLPRPPARGV